MHKLQFAVPCFSATITLHVHLPSQVPSHVQDCIILHQTNTCKCLFDDEHISQERQIKVCLIKDHVHVHTFVMSQFT